MFTPHPVSCVTCHLSHDFFSSFYPKFFLLSGGTRPWRVCYQQGLPRLVFYPCYYFHISRVSVFPGCWIFFCLDSSSYQWTKIFSFQVSSTFSFLYSLVGALKHARRYFLVRFPKSISSCVPYVYQFITQKTSESMTLTGIESRVPPFNQKCL